MVSGLYTGGTQEKSSFFLFPIFVLDIFSSSLLLPLLLYNNMKEKFHQIDSSISLTNLEMNTMPSTAPTSADACLSIVHSLMCHRVS